MRHPDGGDGTGEPTTPSAATTHIESVEGSVRFRQMMESLHRCRLSTLNLLSRGATPHAALEQLALALTELNPNVDVAILILDEEGEAFAQCIAPHLSESECEAVRALPVHFTPGSDGRAPQQRKRSVMTNLTSALLPPEFVAFARNARLKACWSEAVIGTDGSVIGVVELLSRKAIQISDADRLLIDGAADLALAILERHEGEGPDVARLLHARSIAARRDTLLRAVPKILAAPTREALILQVARAIQASGWGSVVVCLFDDWRVSTMACAGLRDEEVQELKAHLPARSDRSSMYGKAFARFRNGASYFIPVESSSPAAPSKGTLEDSPPSTTWTSGDIAYVPIETDDGTILGTISLDEPVDARRPDHDTFRSLEQVAASVALTLMRMDAADAQRTAEAQLRSLLTTLDHRVRNNLASLLTLVRSARPMSSTAEDLVQRVDERIRAMMKIDSMLSASAWESIDLHQLIETVAPSERVGSLTFDGPRIAVTLRQAGAFGLVLHELMQASFDSGALGQPNGQVQVTWTAMNASSPRRPHPLHFTWSENSGEPIEFDDAVRRLMEGLTRSELLGSIELNRMQNDGVRHVMDILLDPQESA